MVILHFNSYFYFILGVHIDPEARAASWSTRTHGLQGSNRKEVTVGRALTGLRSSVALWWEDLPWLWQRLPILELPLRPYVLLLQQSMYPWQSQNRAKCRIAECNHTGWRISPPPLPPFLTSRRSNTNSMKLFCDVIWYVRDFCVMLAVDYMWWLFVLLKNLCGVMCVCGDGVLQSVVA